MREWLALLLALLSTSHHGAAPSCSYSGAPARATATAALNISVTCTPSGSVDGGLTAAAADVDTQSIYIDARPVVNDNSPVQPAVSLKSDDHTEAGPFPIVMESDKTSDSGSPLVEMPSALDMEAMVTRSDPIWTWNMSDMASVPLIWPDAPFAGNGMVGACDFPTIPEISIENAIKCGISP